MEKEIKEIIRVLKTIRSTSQPLIDHPDPESYWHCWDFIIEDLLEIKARLKPKNDSKRGQIPPWEGISDSIANPYEFKPRV